MWPRASAKSRWKAAARGPGEDWTGAGAAGGEAGGCEVAMEMVGGSGDGIGVLCCEGMVE